MRSRRLDRDIRPGPDRETEVGLCERGRVVDAVADHRHDLARVLETSHRRRLLVGQDLGDDTVDADLGRDAPRRFLGVSREEDRGKAQRP